MKWLKLWFVMLFLILGQMQSTPLIVRTGVVNKPFQVLGWVTATYYEQNKVYSWSSNRFEPDTTPLKVLNADLMAGLGLPGNADINLIVPVAKKSFGELNSGGVGDIMVMARYGLFQGSILPVRAALGLGGNLPTGDKDANPALGDGSTDLGFGVSLITANIPFLTGHLRGAYWLNGKNGDVKYGNMLEYVAVMDFGVIPGLTPEIALSGYTQARKKVNGVEVPDSEINRSFFHILLMWKPMPMLTIRPKVALPVKSLCRGGGIANLYPGIDIWLTVP